MGAPRADNKRPDSMITGFEADEMFKNMFKYSNAPNPYRNAWIAARALLNEIYLKEEHQLIQFIDIQLKREERLEREQDYEYELAREERMQAYDALLKYEQDKVLRELGMKPEKTSVELIPTFASAQYHLDQWQNAEENLERLELHREIVQAANSRSLVNNALNQTMTFADGTSVDLGLDPNVVSEIKERISSSGGFMKMLEYNHYRNEQVDIRANELLAKVPNPTIEQKIQVKQQAVDEMSGQGNSDILKFVLNFTKDYAANLKNKLNTEQLGELFKHHKLDKYNNIYKLAEKILLKDIDLDSWREENVKHNHAYIENDLLKKQHQNSYKNILDHLKTNPQLDDELRDQVKSAIAALTPAELMEKVASLNLN